MPGPLRHRIAHPTPPLRRLALDLSLHSRSPSFSSSESGAPNEPVIAYGPSMLETTRREACAKPGNSPWLSMLSPSWMHGDALDGHTLAYTRLWRGASPSHSLPIDMIVFVRASKPEAPRFYFYT